MTRRVVRLKRKFCIAGRRVGSPGQSFRGFLLYPLGALWRRRDRGRLFVFACASVTVVMLCVSPRRWCLSFSLALPDTLASFVRRCCAPPLLDFLLLPYFLPLRPLLCGLVRDRLLSFAVSRAFREKTPVEAAFFFRSRETLLRERGASPKITSRPLPPRNPNHS